MTQIYIYTTPLTVLLSMIYDTSVYMTDSIKSARFQLFIYGLCLALIVGLQHIVDIGNTTFCGHIITNVAKLLSVLNLLDTMWYD